MYIKKNQLKRMIREETNKRISDSLINELQKYITTYTYDLIADSVKILNLRGLKTLNTTCLIYSMQNNNRMINQDTIYNEIRRTSIRKLIKTQYGGRISEEYIKLLIKQIEFHLQELIIPADKICILRGRKTILLRDLQAVMMNKEELQKILGDDIKC